MTKRTLAALAVGLALATAAAFMAAGRSRRDSMTAAPAADSVWYHASDVTLLATTGRPQLVEFFHPD